MQSKLKISFNLIIFVVYIFASHQTFADESIHVLANQEPPLNFSDDGANSNNAAVTGFSSDIVREIIRRTGSDAEIRLMPWARAYKMALTEKNTFLFSMARRESREDLFKWVGPLAKKKSVIYAKKGHNFNINSLEDAKKLGSIATLREDSKEQHLKNEGFTNLKSSSQWEHAIKKLASGRVDAYVQTDLDTPITAISAGIDVNSIEQVYTYAGYFLYIGVSKNTPDELVDKWQKALDDMKNDGFFKKMVDYWSEYYKVDNWVMKEGVLQSE